MSGILPGYGELDLKFRPFSHRNPVTCREAQAPLQALACEFNSLSSRSSLTTGHAESNMLRLPGVGRVAADLSLSPLATKALQGEHPAKVVFCRTHFGNCCTL